MTRAWIASALALWWLAQPVAELWFYRHELASGAYPVDADSIGIPIAFFLAGWILTTPIVAWLVWWVAARTTRARVAWLAFDRTHPVWCGVWSVLLVVAALDQIQQIWRSMADGFIVDVALGVVGSAVLLAARAALCTPPTPSRQPIVDAAPVN